MSKVRYVIVPLEPTEDQVAAGIAQALECAHEGQPAPCTAEHVYQAMVKAGARSISAADIATIISHRVLVRRAPNTTLSYLDHGSIRDATQTILDLIGGKTMVQTATDAQPERGREDAPPYGRNLAAQCRLQARESLDPEYTLFMDQCANGLDQAIKTITDLANRFERALIAQEISPEYAALAVVPARKLVKTLEGKE